MLRITKAAEKGSEVTLQVEGRIVSEWAIYFERETERLLDAGSRVVLDLAGVTEIGPMGVAAVKRLLAKNVVIERCPSLIMSLIEEGTEQ